MNMRRAWRTATAGLAAAALLTMSAGPAAAQLPGLDGLDPSQLDQLLDLLELPEDTPLDAVLTPLQEFLDGGGELPFELPGVPGEDEDGDDTGTDVPTEGADGSIPEAGLGGFSGYANAEGATVFVGLPAALADGLAPLLEALGIDGTLEANGTTLSGIRIDLAQVQADLERAAAGEDISSSSTALITNLLLGSDAAGQPGACTGGPAEVALPPDAATPLLTLTLLGVDCEQTDERAFADVQIAGLDIRLGALLELGLPQEAADGVQQLIDTLNGQLLAPVSEGLCQVLDPLLGVLLPGAVPCEDGEPLLQLRNPLDLDVPIVDLDAVGATGEVVNTDGSVTATATSLFTGLNVLGVACLGGDEPPLEYTSTATSNGTTATREASAPSLALSLCQSEQSLLRAILGDGPLGDIALFEEIVQEQLLDGALQAVFDGVDTLLDTLTTEAITQGSAQLGAVEGAGTTAGTEPFVVASTLPLAGLPGLGDVLGEVAVIVVGGATDVGVNAVPAGEEPEAPETPDEEEPETPEAPQRRLPRTGAGAGVLVGLAALGAAATLRRRDG